MKNERGGPVAIEQLIHVIRGKKVILDSDLARIYGVSTKRFNEQVKRNRMRFPEDFLFQLTRAEVMEVQSLRSQFGFGLINSVDDACRCTLGADVF